MESLVAQRIKSVLEAKQISIAAFSKMIGMQQVTCNRQIRGDQAVSLGLIEGFLKEFDEISAEWLLRGKGNQVIEEPSFLVAEPKPELKEDFIKREWNKTGEGGIPIRGQYESATHFLKRVDEYRKMKAEQKRRYDELTRKQQSILNKYKRTPLPKSEYEADEIKKNYNGEK